MKKPIQKAKTEARRAYASPKLTNYGDIAKLTQNGQWSGNDGGPPGNMMMVCL